MKVKILSNKEVSPGYFKMSVSATDELLKGRPGQFLMVRGDWGSDPFLRRPFSIYRFHKKNSIYLYSNPTAIHSSLFVSEATTGS